MVGKRERGGNGHTMFAGELTKDGAVQIMSAQ